MELDSIVACLLADTAALGVWVLGRTLGDDGPFDKVFASAVHDPSLQLPPITKIGDESH